VVALRDRDPVRLAKAPCGIPRNIQCMAFVFSRRQAGLHRRQPLQALGQRLSGYVANRGLERLPQYFCLFSSVHT
jgi:hypothetical protein